MKRKIFGIALFMAVTGNAAGAVAAPVNAPDCGYTRAPAVSVIVRDPGPRITSTKSLRQINTMAGAHGLDREGFRVLGITEIDVQSGINVQFRGDPMRHGRQKGLCVGVAQVDVEFGLKKHNVHVPREYPRGSCQFNVVMRHEMAHVDVNRRTVRKYATILKNKVRSTMRRAGAVFAHSMERGQAVQARRLRAIIDVVAEDFNAELERLHAEIDSPDSAYAAQSKCRSW